MNTIIVPGRLGRVVAAIDQKIGGCTQQRHFFAMTLNFSNPSRSYDETGSGVRFWGYDGALEVAFFIEEGAFKRISPGTRQNEAGLMTAFDRNRDQILEVAS